MILSNYNLLTISSYFFKMFSLNMSFYTLHNNLKALAQGGNINAFFTITQSFTMTLMLLEILKTIQLLPLIPFMVYAPLALVILHSLTHDEHFYFLPIVYYFCGPLGYVLLQLACHFMPHILESNSTRNDSTWLNYSYLILFKIHTFLHNIQKIITKKIDVFLKDYCNLSNGNDDFRMLIINVLYYSYYCAVIPYILTVTYYQPFSLMFRLFLMSVDIYPLYYFYILHNHRHYVSATLQMTLEYIAKIFNIMNVLPKTLSSIALMLSPFYIWHEYTDANMKAAKDELSYAQWIYIAHKNNLFFSYVMVYVLYVVTYSVSTIVMLIYSGSSRLREKTKDIVFINYITCALDYTVQELFSIPQRITHDLHYLLKTFMNDIDYIRSNSNTYLPSALSGIIATVCHCINTLCEMLISIIDIILTLEDILSGWVTYFDAFITYYNSLTTTQHFYTIQPSSQQETTQNLSLDTIFTDLSEDMLQFDVQKASFFSPSIQSKEENITNIPQAHMKLERKHIDFIASTFNNLLPILKNNSEDKEKFCESMWNSTGVIEDTNTHHGIDFLSKIPTTPSPIVLSEDDENKLITITTELKVNHYSLLLNCILQRISTDDLNNFHRESPSSTAHYCDALSENFSHIIPGRCKISLLQNLLDEIAPLQDLLNITQIIQHITDSMALLTSAGVVSLEIRTRVEVKNNIRAYCTMVLKTTCRYYARIISLKNFDTILLPFKAFYIEGILDTAAGLRQNGEENFFDLVDTFWLMQSHDIAALLDIEKCYADLGDDCLIKDNLEEHLTTHDIMLNDTMLRDTQTYAGLIFYLSQKDDSFMSLLASHIKDYGTALISTFIVHYLIKHKDEKYLKTPNIRYLLSDYQNTLMRMHGGCSTAFVTSLQESILQKKTQDTVATSIEQAAFIYRKNVIQDSVHLSNSKEYPTLSPITNMLDGIRGVHSDAQIQKMLHIHIGPISTAAFLDAVTEPGINNMLQYQLYTITPLCDPYQLLCAVIADFSQYDMNMFLPSYHQGASNILPQYIFGELFLDHYVTQNNAFNYPLVNNVPQLDYFIRMMKEMIITSDPSVEDNDELTDTINRYILNMTPQNFVGFIIVLLLHKGLIAPKKEIKTDAYIIKHRDQQSILKDIPLMQHKMSSIIHDALYIFYGPLRDAALYTVNTAYPNSAKDASPVSSMYFKKGTKGVSKDTYIQDNSSLITQTLGF